MVSQARSQCKTVLVNKALVLSVRRHHAQVTHQIMLLVLSSAGAKGSNELIATSVLHSMTNIHIPHCFLIVLTRKRRGLISNPTGRLKDLSKVTSRSRSFRRYANAGLTSTHN